MADVASLVSGMSEGIASALRRAVTTLDRAEVPHLVFGSIASVFHGRPAETGDVDLLIRPTDAERALGALAADGFRTHTDNPEWLHKAEADGVTVDLITRAAGAVSLDDRMLDRAVRVDLGGTTVPLLSAEDTLVVEALAQSPETPMHWENGAAIVGERGPDLDWGYLVERATVGPARVLALLVYAGSCGLAVPARVLRELFARAVPD